jgi:hypothetical protein
MTEYEQQILEVEHLNNDLHRELSALQRQLTADEFYRVLHNARLEMYRRRTAELRDHIRLTKDIIADRK